LNDIAAASPTTLASAAQTAAATLFPVNGSATTNATNLLTTLSGVTGANATDVQKGYMSGMITNLTSDSTVLVGDAFVNGLIAINTVKNSGGNGPTIAASGIDTIASSSLPASVALTPTQTTALLASVANLDTVNLPTNLTVFKTDTNVYNITSLSSPSYFIMKPHTSANDGHIYTFTYLGDSTNPTYLAFNPTTSTIDQYEALDSSDPSHSYKPGQSLELNPVGNGYFLQIFAAGSLGGGGNGGACFTESSRILTPTGYRLAKDIKNGDLVTTADGRTVAVKAYNTTQRVDYGSAPYLIPAGSFGKGAPEQDLRLSPWHAIQVRKGVWQKPATMAETNPKLVQYGIGTKMTYYHFEAPNYFTDNLVCDGTIVESFANKQAKPNVYTYNRTLNGYTRHSPSNLRLNA